jgi:hypothetical protein
MATPKETAAVWCWLYGQCTPAQQAQWQEVLRPLVDGAAELMREITDNPDTGPLFIEGWDPEIRNPPMEPLLGFTQAYGRPPSMKEALKLAAEFRD